MSARRDNSGALFKAKASDNPNWPQYEGSCLIEGTEYWISAWVKEGKSGKFFSLAFKPKTESYKGGIRKTPPKDKLDADIPF